MVERHSEVGQDAVDRLHAVVPQEIPQITEIAVHGRESGIPGKLPVGLGAFYRLAVLVETEQPSPRGRVEQAQNSARMPPSAKGAVDINS